MTETDRPPRRPGRRLATLWPTMVVGAVLWVLLWGDLSWANVLSGALLGALVALAFPLPPVATGTTVRPLQTLHLAWRFLSDLTLASFQVALTAVKPGRTPDGGLVSVQLRTSSDLFIATTSGLSSMVPGTLVIDLDRPQRVLRLHVLDLERSGGPEAVRQDTLALEERVLRAFASRTELERVGLAGPHGLSDRSADSSADKEVGR